MKFTQYDQDTAPPGSSLLLENSVRTFGVIPRLHAVMAESPAVLQSYQILHEQFQSSRFDSDEVMVVWLTISIEHDCVAAYHCIAESMNVDAVIYPALRDKTTLPTTKLQVLHETTLEVLTQRGHLGELTLTAFRSAGYSEVHLLEIVPGISQTILSNYIGILANITPEKSFEDLTRSKQIRVQPESNQLEVNENGT